MRTDYDDYDEYDDLDGPGFRWMSIIVLFLAVGGFFSLAWYAYYTGTRSMQNEEVIVIEAETTPIKEQPEDRGGMKIAHQDKTIYEAISEDKKPEKKVQVMAEPEKPVMPVVEKIRQVEEKLQPKPKPKPKEMEAVSNVDFTPVHIIPRTKPKAAAPSLVADPFSPVSFEEDAPSRSETTTVVMPKKEAPAISRRQAEYNGFKIQLGAFRSETEAQQQWRRISVVNRDILQGLPHRVVRADLGSKGIYYRLRVGGLASEVAAGTICQKLQAKGQDCFPAGR